MILYGDRSRAMKVREVETDKVKIEGPSGGEYILFEADDRDRVLVSKEGKRRYASYVENLRKTGEWTRTSEDTWKHSKTGAEIRLEQKETGYWTIKSEDFDLEQEINLPLYGYSDRETAIEEVEELIQKHPEG